MRRTDKRTARINHAIWANRLSRAAVAREMGIYPQRLSEMLDPGHIVTDDEAQAITEAIERLLEARRIHDEAPD